MPDKSIKAELRVEGLNKVFGKKTAVNDVNFSMNEGSIVGLLGPNGAGKTTTFYMIVGFIKPTYGKIYLNNQDITALPMYKRALAGISYLPQEPSIFRKLTVTNNIWAVLETRNELSQDEKKEKLEFLIDELGLDKIREQMAYTLSGGERRRTEIARALASDPHFLLLDEPFAGIDPIAISEIKKIIKQLSKQGIGVLITDHNVRDTLEITDKAFIIHFGEILVSGTGEELTKNETAREIYLGSNFSM